MPTHNLRYAAIGRLVLTIVLATAVVAVGLGQHRLFSAAPPGSGGMIAHVDGVELSRAATDSGTSGVPARKVRCTQNPATPAFQVLYGYPHDRGSRLGVSAATIRADLESANGIIVASALESSAHWDVRLRVRCDSQDRITIRGFALSKVGADGSGETFDQIVAAGRSAGYRDQNTKYVVFWDSPIDGSCGRGQMYVDQSRSVNNANNAGNSYAAVFGTSCWDGISVLHEIGHTMGAVQDGAPHSTGAYHCNQVRDVMCYADGGPAGRTSSLVQACSAFDRFDCHHDDYFRVGSTGSGYLATHWNVGWTGNRFLSFLHR